MTIAEQVYALVRSLPQDKANQVLLFAELIQGKLENRPSDIDELPWPEFVLSLAGAWGDDFPSLEEIRENMEQDIGRSYNSCPIRAAGDADRSS